MRNENPVQTAPGETAPKRNATKRGWIAVTAVAAVAASIIAYKELGPRSGSVTNAAPTVSASREPALAAAGSVLLFADPTEAEESCGCGQIIRLVRAAAARGVAALLLAFAGGVVTGLNPCCLPLYPAAAATCCAARCEQPRWAFWNAGAFVAGTAAATTVLGVIAALAGGALTAVGGWPRHAIAFVPLIMAVHLLGWLRLPIPAFAPKGGRPGLAGAFVAGLLLSLVFAPCGTPVLASVLSYAAYEGSVPYGAVLLFLYGLGAGVPIFAIGTTAGGLTARLGSGKWRIWIDRGAGAMLLAIGVYLLWTA